MPAVVGGKTGAWAVIGLDSSATPVPTPSGAALSDFPSCSCILFPPTRLGLGTACRAARPFSPARTSPLPTGRSTIGLAEDSGAATAGLRFAWSNGFGMPSGPGSPRRTSGAIATISRAPLTRGAESKPSTGSPEGVTGSPAAGAGAETDLPIRTGGFSTIIWGRVGTAATGLDRVAAGTAGSEGGADSLAGTLLGSAGTATARSPCAFARRRETRVVGWAAPGDSPPTATPACDEARAIAGARPSASRAATLTACSVAVRTGAASTEVVDGGIVREAPALTGARAATSSERRAPGTAGTPACPGSVALAGSPTSAADQPRRTPVAAVRRSAGEAPRTGPPSEPPTIMGSATRRAPLSPVRSPVGAGATRRCSGARLSETGTGESPTFGATSGTAVPIRSSRTVEDIRSSARGIAMRIAGYGAAGASSAVAAGAAMAPATDAAGSFVVPRPPLPASAEEKAWDDATSGRPAALAVSLTPDHGGRGPACRCAVATGAAGSVVAVAAGVASGASSTEAAASPTVAAVPTGSFAATSRNGRGLNWSGRTSAGRTEASRSTAFAPGVGGSFGRSATSPSGTTPA